MTDLPSPSRPSPPVVPPVEFEGVRYEQDDYESREKGDQPGGYLAAVDAGTGARLWRLKVYDIADHRAVGLPDLPLMFQSMKLVPGAAELEIENESGSVYRVNLARRTATLVGGPERKTTDKPKH